MAITSEDCARLLHWLEASHNPTRADRIWEEFSDEERCALKAVRSWRQRDLQPKSSFSADHDQPSSRMEQLLTISPAVLYSFTPEDLRVTYMSPSVENLIGISATNAAGTVNWWVENILPEDVESAKLSLKTWLNQGAPGILQRRYRMRHATGHIIWVISQTRALRDPNNRILEIIGAVSDISQQVILTSQLEQIAHHMPGAIFQFRQDTEGKYSVPYASPGIKDLIGFNPSEIRHNPALLLTRIHPDDQAKVLELARYTTNNFSEWRAVYRILHPQNGTIWVEIRTTPIMQDDGALLWSGIALDLTETMHTQEQLKEYQERMELVLQGTSAGIWDWNIQTGKIVSNKAWTDLLGLPPEAAQGATRETWHSLLHPDDQSVSLQEFEKHARGITPFYACDLRVLKADGRWHWVRMRGRISSRGTNGEPLRMAGILLDINAEQLARDTLADQLIFQNILIDTLPNPIFVKNADLHFVTVNKAYEQAFGVRRESIIGRTVLELDFLPMESRQQYHEEDQRLLDSHATVHRESKFLFADGHWHHCLYWSTGFGSEPLATRGVVGIIVDISEQKRIARELARARHTAEQATQTKSQFLANMSHEIRTPMNAILGMTGLLQRTNLDKSQRDYAGKIELASRTLLDIINDVLDFSKIEAGKLLLDPAPFDLRDILDSLGAILIGSLGTKDLEIVFDAPVFPPRKLTGDALRLQQVLLNLLSNAVKFTTQGEIILEIRETMRTSELVGLTFTVHDSGIGIPADKQMLIFEEFSQAEASTTRHYGGSGLGLSISRQLVSMMGGEIRLASAEGQGSSFSFTLNFPYEHCSEAVPGSAQLILVIDDTPATCRALAGLCEHGGFQVRTAASAAMAAELLQGGLHPHAVILDIEIDNPELLRPVLFECTPPIPLIFTFRNASQDMPEHSGHMRLIKPVTPRQMYETLAQALQQTIPHGTEAPALGERLSGLKLLVVDDNALNQEVARALLEGEGADVVIASSGKEALALTATGIHGYDAILLDIQMPDMDGYSVAGEMRVRHGGLTPIVAMTANTQSSDVQSCLNAGMNAHIGKPVDLEELVLTLRKLCFLDNYSSPSQPRDHESLLPDQSAQSGIDHDKALARLGGNLRLYTALTGAFRREQQARINRLRQAFEQNDLESAIRESHTLKSVAGTLGATGLMTQADALEQELKQCRGLNTFPDIDLDSLIRTFEEAAATLENWARQSGAADTVLVDKDSPRQAPPGHLLDNLIRLLEQGNMLAMDAFTELENATGQIAGLSQLRAAMLKLDFPAAIALCTTLRQEGWA